MNEIPPNPLRQMTVCIVGLGLMGGSLALGLRGHVRKLVGVDRRPATVRQALEKQVVDAGTDDLAEGLAAADLVVLAVPIQTILSIMGQLPHLRPDGLMVMDLGSTKQEVVAAMDDLPPSFEAIGGHPMCGKESSGLAAATADLYRDSAFILCSSGRTTAGMEAVALQIVRDLEARPVFLDAVDHDNRVALVSHLPALLSAALMRLASSEDLWLVSSSGFRDTARLAGSDTGMMLDILTTNQRPILEILEVLEKDLDRLRRLLVEEDQAGIAEWLAEAQVRYAAYRRFRSAELYRAE